MAKVVSLKFVRLGEGPNDIRTTLYEDSPEYQKIGTYLHLGTGEVVAIFAHLGVPGEESYRVLKAVSSLFSDYRLQIQINDEQDQYLRRTFPSQ